jgi:aminoglycoside 6'-N-acetyltransferase I
VKCLGDAITDMEIINYNNNYLDSIIELYISVFSKPPWNDKWDLENCRTYLLELINNPVFLGYLFMIDDKLIGCCFGHCKSWYSGKELFIDELFIKTDDQKKGYGSKFLSYIEKDLSTQNIKRLTLLTKKESTPELFYKKCGFNYLDTLGYMYKDFS